MSEETFYCNSVNEGPEMAVLRKTVRWCRARLCTSFLFVVFCVVAWFAISASYHSLQANSGSNLHADDVEYDGRDHKLRNPSILQTNNDDDDEDIQFCKYPLAINLADTEEKWGIGTEPDTCGQHSKSLFYFKDNVLLMHNNALKGIGTLDRCVYRGIELKSDEEFKYTQSLEKHHPVPFKLQIDQDFVHVQCYVDESTHRRNVLKEEGVAMVQEKTEEKWKGRKRRDDSNREDGLKSRPNVQDYDAKAFHRSVVHRNSPRLVGSLGLPDPSDSILGDNSKRHLRQQARRLHSNEVQPITDQETEPTEAADSNREMDHDADKLPETSMTDTEPQREEGHFQSPTDEEQEQVIDDVPLFDQFVVQVSEKSEVTERVRKTDLSQLNVLMLALDSISQFSFERNFRKTSLFLREKLKAVVMNGYNSIGDAATAAVIPLITGFKEDELRESRRSGSEGQYVDVLPFIWNKYEQKGYVTLFAEDQPDLGTFQTHFYGFELNPVDHYMRPFWLAASASKLHSSSQPNCLGSIPKHQYVFDYVADFFKKYKTIPKFAFGFVSEFNRSQFIDEDLHAFLKSLKDSGHLENTLVIIVGDHGVSYGQQRQTIAGKLEESFPYLSLSFPDEFRKQFDQLLVNLRTNKDRLTSAFDVHETLMSLLDINEMQSRPVNKTSRAVSLLQKIPKQRTCSIASIDVHWCTCVKYEQVDLENGATASSSFLFSSSSLRPDRLGPIAVRAINRQLDHEDKDRQCARLSFLSLKSARIVFPNDLVMDQEDGVEADQVEVFNYSRRFPLASVRYHQIVFETSPSDAVFEATMTIDSTRDSNDRAVINGMISRVDEYGKQSDCIRKTHPDLRKYCFCS